MVLKDGWMKETLNEVSAEVRSWPEWMRIRDRSYECTPHEIDYSRRGQVYLADLYSGAKLLAKTIIYDSDK